MKKLPNSGSKSPNASNNVKGSSKKSRYLGIFLILLALPGSLLAAQGQENLGEILPNAGFSLSSLGRGMLGMLILLFIAFIFSNNRSRINWKTTGLGILLQLILAIGVLKVPAVQWVFNQMGIFFNSVLEFTAAGSAFLFGNLMKVDDPTIGYVFAFQILPTILFFSALTSVLYYLGVIQKVVKGLAWMLTRILGISGPESLSVAGNIFLGQTEAP